MPVSGIGAGVAAEARNGLRSQLQRAAARQKAQASCGTQSPVARYWTFFAIETAWSAKRS